LYRLVGIGIINCHNEYTSSIICPDIQVKVVKMYTYLYYDGIKTLQCLRSKQIEQTHLCPINNLCSLLLVEYNEN